MFKGLAVVSMAAVLVVGASGSRTVVSCPSATPVIALGICTRVFGVGFHVRCHHRAVHPFVDRRRGSRVDVAFREGPHVFNVIAVGSDNSARAHAAVEYAAGLAESARLPQQVGLG